MSGKQIKQAMLAGSAKQFLRTPHKHVHGTPLGSGAMGVSGALSGLGGYAQGTPMQMKALPMGGKVIEAFKGVPHTSFFIRMTPYQLIQRLEAAMVALQLYQEQLVNDALFDDIEWTRLTKGTDIEGTSYESFWKTLLVVTSVDNPDFSGFLSVLGNMDAAQQQALMERLGSSSHVSESIEELRTMVSELTTISSFCNEVTVDGSFVAELMKTGKDVPFYPDASLELP